MYYIGSKKLPLDRPFNLDGFQYPADWLRYSTPQQREELGITEYKGKDYKEPKIDKPIIDETEQLEVHCLTEFILSAIINMSLSDFDMTVAEVKAEVQLLTLENIRKYPCSISKCDQFYSMWQRFGPEAARTAFIPYIWDGRFPRPSEHFGVELNVSA